MEVSFQRFICFIFLYTCSYWGLLSVASWVGQCLLHCRWQEMKWKCITNEQTDHCGCTRSLLQTNWSNQDPFASNDAHKCEKLHFDWVLVHYLHSWSVRECVKQLNHLTGGSTSYNTAPITKTQMNKKCSSPNLFLCVKSQKLSKVVWFYFPSLHFLGIESSPPTWHIRI